MSVKSQKITVDYITSIIAFYSWDDKCNLREYVLVEEDLVSLGDRERRFTGFKDAKPGFNPCN